MCRRAGLVLPALFVHVHFTARKTPAESIRPAAVWAIVVLYKMQDEYITHVGNVDRTELIRGIFS